LTELLPAFDREESRPIVQEVVDVLEGLEELVDAGPPRERFQQFAADRLAHQKALYFGPRRPSKGQDQELRPEIFQALGNLAKDASVQRQAEAMTRAWLATPKAADPDLIGPAVRMASSTAGKDHFEALRRVFQKTTVTDERLLALGGLFAFQDEGLLAEALSMALSNEIRLQDMRYVFRGVRATEKSRAIASAWVKAHWAPLVARAKGRLAESLVGTVGAQCTEEERMATAAFFRAQAESLRGEERAVALRLERLATCTLLRQEMSGPLADALAKAPAAVRGPRAPAKP
jgi:hypothetical protein